MHPMLNVAVRAARRAGRIISRASLDLERVKVARKQRNDFVTEVDQASEEAIIDTLLTAYPGHAILAEESGHKPAAGSGAAAHPEARAFASGADDVLAGASEVATLEQALAGASLAVAVSAQPREFGPAPCGPRDAAILALDELAAHPGHEVAFVFGCERTGLSIGQALACQSLLTIPSDPEFSSLNLSQAAQIVAWELRAAALARDGGARVVDARVAGACLLYTSPSPRD